jgi:hypothetical protein
VTDTISLKEPHEFEPWICHHFCPYHLAERKAREKEELISLIAAKLWPGDVGRDS